ncbi:RNA-directed DNA polymerase from mobile element jockey-like, partial [Brachionus plicatilis]
MKLCYPKSEINLTAMAIHAMNKFRIFHETLLWLAGKQPTTLKSKWLKILTHSFEYQFFGANLPPIHLSKDKQKKNFPLYENRQLVDLLFKSLVRTHLEFAVGVWNPYRRSDIDVLEQVQRRFSKMVPELKLKPYLEIRETLGWNTIEERCRRGDLIQLHKIQRVHDRVTFINGDQKLALDGLDSQAGNTRTCHKAIELQLIRNCGDRHKFFTNRTAGNWNTLDALLEKKDHLKSLCLMRIIQNYISKNSLFKKIGNRLIDKKAYAHVYFWYQFLEPLELRAVAKKVMEKKMSASPFFTRKERDILFLSILKLTYRIPLFDNAAPQPRTHHWRRRYTKSRP